MNARNIEILLFNSELAVFQSPVTVETIIKMLAVEVLAESGRVK